MFGYLRPDEEELKKREITLYRSVYCGLCREMGRRYGVLSRLLLSYDGTVLAMLTLSLREESCTVRRRHCPCQPWKRCLFCGSQGEAFAFAGAISVLLAYGKLLDTIADDGFWKKTIARFLCFLLRRNYRKAAAAYPDAADKMQEMLRSQQAAEKANASIDRAADATAVFTSFVCESLSEDSTVREVLRVFGYQTGRWIYLMDAADDLPGDLRKNRFNPFRQVYLKYPQGYEIYAGEVLQQTASQLRLAYELLPLHSFRDILDNVIYDGLEIRQAECLFRKHSQPSDLYPRLARRGRLPREEGDMTYSFGKEEMI